MRDGNLSRTYLLVNDVEELVWRDPSEMIHLAQESGARHQHNRRCRLSTRVQSIEIVRFIEPFVLAPHSSVEFDGRINDRGDR